MHRKCRICGEPIILKPSAEERAIKYGGVPSDYLKLFDAHSSCALAETQKHAAELIKSMTDKEKKAFLLHEALHNIHQYPKR